VGVLPTISDYLFRFSNSSRISLSMFLFISSCPGHWFVSREAGFIASGLSTVLLAL
jgi:hypothetical protein